MISMRLTASMLWVWLLVLVALNIIPIGNDANQSLSGNKIYSYRLDYLVHLIMILGFAWIWVFGKIINVRWFADHETVKYSLVVICASIGLEIQQLLIPWRSFNPVDLGYNVVGAVLVTGIIFTTTRIKKCRPS